PPPTPPTTLFPYTTLFRSIPVSLRVRGQQHEMKRGRVQLGVPIRHPPRRDVGLHPDDGRDGVRAGLLVELDRPVQRAVIGDRQRDRKSTRLNSSHVKISYA